MSEAKNIKAPTPGEWMVTTLETGLIAVVRMNRRNQTHDVIATFGYEDSDNVDELTANAALLAIAKDMLDVLIAIQTSLPDALDYKAINAMISDVFAKLANEAGEEL